MASMNCLVKNQGFILLQLASHFNSANSAQFRAEMPADSFMCDSRQFAASHLESHEGCALRATVSFWPSSCKRSVHEGSCRVNFGHVGWANYRAT
jgi:hypothetical protein